MSCQRVLDGALPSDDNVQSTHHLHLEPLPRLVSTAGAFVREHAPPLAPETADVLVLLTSELVTNAVLHGRSEVCLEVEASSARLRVSVLDENSRRPVEVAEDPDALDGRGLALVGALAVRWGVEERSLGKAVWFEVVDS